ncbi:MAG TPA: hypothetical protein ENK28_00060 [Aliiroseovarius sp.]|nr:hypothetical protein [Aliiroseovarius sp.]
MNDLYDRFNESCAGRDGVTVLYPEDHMGQCVSENGSEQWMNLMESALRDQVEACESRSG